MSSLQFLLSHTSTDLGEGHSPVNKPINPFFDKVTTFLFEAADEILTLGTSDLLTKREEAEVLASKGTEEATIL